MITSAIPKLPFIDKQTTIHFYTTQLGFALTANYTDYLIMTKDAAELHFFAYPTLQPHKSDFMIYLQVDNDIHALYEQWKNVSPPHPTHRSTCTKTLGTNRNGRHRPQWHPTHIWAGTVAIR